MAIEEKTVTLNMSASGLRSACVKCACAVKIINHENIMILLGNVSPILPHSVPICSSLCNNCSYICSAILQQALQETSEVMMVLLEVSKTHNVMALRAKKLKLKLFI